MSSLRPTPARQISSRGIDRELLIESLVIMAVSIVLFAVTFTFDRVPEIFAQGIQPTVFPRAVLIIMLVLAGIQALKATRLSAAEIASLKPVGSIPRVVYLTGLMLIAFVIAMRWIGTFPTIIVFCPALALLWGERRIWMMVLGFSVFIGFTYVLFRMIMNVPLP